MSDVEEFKRLNTRKASVVHVGGFRPTGDPFASHFGLVPVARPAESWPTHEGRPLLFVCQFNLTAAPFVPDVLSDIALITFFADRDVYARSETNGADWCLRAYGSLDGLVPLDAPDDAPRVEDAPDVQRGFECRWELREDHPSYDDPDLVVPEGLDPDEADFESVWATKIGGYPSNIQGEQWWHLRADHPACPKYCLQIDSEEKVGLAWGDNGIVYIARGTAPGHEDEWFLDAQCY